MQNADMLQILSSLDTHITHFQGSHAWKSESIHETHVSLLVVGLFYLQRKNMGIKTSESNLRFWMRAGAFGK